MRPYLLSVIFISNISLAQVDSEGEKIPDPHRFYLGLMAAPELADDFMTTDDNALQGTVDFLNEFYLPKFSYTAGLDFLFVMNQRISLQSGIHYSNKGNRIKKAYLTDMFGVPYDPEAIKANYSHHYIEVPLKINYNVCFEKFKLYFSGGVIPGFLAARSTTNIVYYQNGDVERNTTSTISNDATRINLSATIGTGLDFFINSKMTFRIEPTAKLSLLKLAPDANFTSHLWSTGINFSYLIGI
jgi:hypothetical protein